MVHHYLTLARSRDVTVRLAAVFTSAASLGMLSLTVVLCVHGWTGSFVLAGATGALFNLGNAAGITLQGRLLDRYDDRTVVATAGASCVVAILAFVWAGTSAAPEAALLAAVAAAGSCVPALTAAVRAWLPRTIAAPSERTAAYALLSVVFQAAVVLGPVLVAVCVAVGNATLAALAAAGLVALATGTYVAGTSAARPPAAVTGPGGGIERRLVLILAVTALGGAAAGTLLVVLPALMIQQGIPAVSGVLFAAIAVGEAAGALAYGASRSRRPSFEHLARCLICAAVLYALAACVYRWIPALLATLLLLGAAVGPVSVVVSALLDDAARPEAIGRTYGLMVSVNLVALGAGSAVAGALVERAGPAPALVLAGALCLLGAGVGTLGRRPHRSGGMIRQSRRKVR